MRLRLLLETPPSEHSSVLRADAAARARLVLHAGSCCTASHHTRELQADFCKVPAAPSAHVCVPYLLGTTKAHQGTPSLCNLGLSWLPGWLVVPRLSHAPLTSHMRLSGMAAVFEPKPRQTCRPLATPDPMKSTDKLHGKPPPAALCSVVPRMSAPRLRARKLTSGATRLVLSTLIRVCLNLVQPPCSPSFVGCSRVELDNIWQLDDAGLAMEPNRGCVRGLSTPIVKVDGCWRPSLEDSAQGESTRMAAVGVWRAITPSVRRRSRLRTRTYVPTTYRFRVSRIRSSSLS